MRASVIWYRSRPSDELYARLRDTLAVIEADLSGETTTIDPTRLPLLLARSLRDGDGVIVVGGMDLIKQEENSVFILSRCMSFPLEQGKSSRSDYIYDTLRGTRLPSFNCAMLFPSANGGPEGMVVYSGTQLLILLPWLDRQHMDILDMIAAYLPEMVFGKKEEEPKEPEAPPVPEYVTRAAQRHRDRTIKSDVELGPEQIRYMFENSRGEGDIMETNRAATAASEQERRAKEAAAYAERWQRRTQHLHRHSDVQQPVIRDDGGFDDDFDDMPMRSAPAHSGSPEGLQRSPRMNRRGAHTDDYGEDAPLLQELPPYTAPDAFYRGEEMGFEDISPAPSRQPARSMRATRPDPAAAGYDAAEAAGFDDGYVPRRLRKADITLDGDLEDIPPEDCVPFEELPPELPAEGSSVKQFFDRLVPPGSMMRMALPPLLRSLSVVLVLCIIVASCFIGINSYESGLLGPRVIYQSELAAMYSGETDETAVSELPEGALPRFSKLYAENGDIGGFISIPGTDLSHPILQSPAEDPNVYSRLDFYGREDKRGSLYFDVSNRIASDSDDFNLVVYGNTTTDKSLFSELHNYTNRRYLAEHQLINLDTLYNSSQWVVFSVCYVSGDTIGEFNYANTQFYGRYDHQIHLYNLYIRSLYYTATEVFPDEHIITLVTDSDSFEGAKLLVCARKVREDEDLSYLGTNVVENDLVLMPDLWYAINDKLKPAVPRLELPTDSPDDLYTSVSWSDVTTTATTATSTATTATTTTTAPVTTTTTPAPTTTTTAADTPPDEPIVIPEDTSSGDLPEVPPETTTTTTTATAATTTLPASTGAPNMRITSNGKVVSGSPADVLAMIIEAEMGGSYSLEALKAQAVAAYTFYLYSGGSAKAPSFPTKKASGICKEAAAAVAGQKMVFKGIAPYTPYYAISAGATANNKDINGANLSYLSSVDCSVDKDVSGYRVVKEVSANDVAAKVKNKKGIDLKKISDKSSWFEVLERDANDLYVLKVKVGDTSYKGNTLHLSILGYSCLRSPCFWIEYDASRDMFIFTSLGYGTGVGMSQKGANEYAKQGYDYDWILQHFYPGTTIKG